jgi:predicted glycoside hydrolase/deacetylase ChbG (UPF0249 family)
MNPVRQLVVVADDYGIGPETSRGILELASVGVVTGAVLLVNSPFAEAAAGAWRRARPHADLGWHPCLTMDEPVAPSAEVPSLVGPDGRLGPLPRFLRDLLLGRVRPEHIARELAAQLARFRALTGQQPMLVNAHHHVALFHPVGAILRALLRPLTPRPWLRRVHEPWRLLPRLGGARIKRVGLSLLGRRAARMQERAGFPGSDALAGIGSPCADPAFFTRRLARTPGTVVELMCHPGWTDPTLAGRDDSAGQHPDPRVGERRALAAPDFSQAYRRAGFRLARPAELLTARTRRSVRVA